MNSKRLYVRGIFAFILALVAVGLFLRVQWKGPEPSAISAGSSPVPTMANNAYAATAQPALIPATFAEVAKSLDPVVVSIFTTQVIHQDENLRRFFAMPDQKQASLGSGFVIDPEGYILTNAHVVSQADDIRVQFTDKSKYRAKLVGQDHDLDLALIKIETPNRRFASAALGDSDALQVGDWVVAVGNPYGLGGTVTAGIVSAKGRFIHQNPYDDFIQTDASINPGNSGGPLVSLRGEVVGINSAIFSPTGGNIGISFAIPVNLAKKVLTQLKTQGKVTRAQLGVLLDAVTPELAQTHGLAEVKGAFVTDVLPNSPAERAGIKKGDIIIQLDGRTIADKNDFMRTVTLSPVGSNITILIIRDGKQMQITATLAERPSDQEMAAMGRGVIRSEALGIGAAVLTPEQAQQSGLPAGVVIVAEMNPNGPSVGQGIALGDVILKINGQPMQTLADFEQVTRDLNHGDVARIMVQRGRGRGSVAIRIP